MEEPTKKSFIAEAIIAVMNEVEGIEKTSTIGEGQYQYKGVPDKEVKKIVGKAMAKNGLCIIPIKVTPTTRIDRWVEGTKTKQSIFTEVVTEYKLLHKSGEYEIVSGYGHGVDTQDKGAGKSTTYALKYALLYLFLVPTGKIDDADNEHSNAGPVPQAPKDNRPGLTQKGLDKVISRMKEGDPDVYDKTMAAFRLTPDQIKQIEAITK